MGKAFWEESVSCPGPAPRGLARRLASSQLTGWAVALWFEWVARCGGGEGWHPGLGRVWDWSLGAKSEPKRGARGKASKREFA